MSTPDFQLARDPFGKLVLTTADLQTHVGIVPVRAFPINAPDEGVSLVSQDGRELVWIERLSALPAPMRQLLDDELAVREFSPSIRAIRAVSTFSTPSTWTVDTDRGTTDFVLKSEDDIRRLGQGRLLISSGQGLYFSVPDTGALDKHSRKLLERFL